MAFYIALSDHVHGWSATPGQTEPAHPYPSRILLHCNGHNHIAICLHYLKYRETIWHEDDTQQRCIQRHLLYIVWREVWVRWSCISNFAEAVKWEYQAVGLPDGAGKGLILSFSFWGDIPLCLYSWPPKSCFSRREQEHYQPASLYWIHLWSCTSNTQVPMHLGFVFAAYLVREIKIVFIKGTILPSLKSRSTICLPYQRSALKCLLNSASETETIWTNFFLFCFGHWNSILAS